MLELPTDLPRKYRYQLRVFLQHGTWKHSYELIGSRGGLQLHVSGPHKYDGQERWSAGLEIHSRTPLNGDDRPPTHDHCWLLQCPCWSDGTTRYAEEHFLPHVLDGRHDVVFRYLAADADVRFGAEPRP